ncbi:DUF6318 family protein [Ornithinimicrobium kibberense]|uniref:DUF6318 family protein n=2 Tax=Ornithinimicrobium kibberense TaxID=282060 RepID=A0ABV5UZG0_9MICO|nr:DUF6318 family protein [Ornithinimicrobium kibberense]
MIVAVSALLALSACDTTSEPSAPPPSEDALTTATAEPPAPVEDAEVTTEPEPTSEEPTEEAAPEMPAEATEFTEEGAEAFVEHYVFGLDYAYKTGDTEHMDPWSSDACESCSALLTDIPENPDGESTFRLGASTTQLIGEELARVESALSVLRGSGEGDGGLVFDLRHANGSWVVESIRLQEAP